MHRPTLPLQGCPPASRKTMDLSTGAGIPHRSWGSTPSWGYPLGNDPFLPARGDKDVRDWHFSQTPFPVSRTSHTSTKTTNSASRTTAPSKCSSTPRSTPTPSPGPKTATRPEPKPSTMARVRACAWGGAKGIRTPDLFHAMEARYQLRHSPEYCGRGSTLPNRCGLVKSKGPEKTRDHDGRNASGSSPLDMLGERPG